MTSRTFTSRRIAPAVSYHLLQEIRLVHALAETSFTVCVPEEEAYKVDGLGKTFGMSYDVGVAGATPLDAIRVEHVRPRTTVGDITRALIFPHAIVEHCRSLWREDRDRRFFFAGLITPARKRFFETWGERHLEGDAVRLRADGRWRRGLDRVQRWLGREPMGTVQVAGDLTVWSSRRGRHFPLKAWDPAYYEHLARSQFVLCPSGDYVWTYRFFEAALCGAIPIVDAACPAYEGFRYHTADEVAGRFVWSREAAEHNARLCRARITVARERLDEELCKLVSERSHPSQTESTC